MKNINTLHNAVTCIIYVDMTHVICTCQCTKTKINITANISDFSSCDTFSSLSSQAMKILVI